jgi:hypothetical protein
MADVPDLPVPVPPESTAQKNDWLAKILGRWEDLLDEVDYKDIPLALVSKMIVHLKDGKVIELNIKEMVTEYELNYEKFEEVLDKKLESVEHKLDHIDWHLDTNKAIEQIETATNQTLKNI